MHANACHQVGPLVGFLTRKRLIPKAPWGAQQQLHQQHRPQGGRALKLENVKINFDLGSSFMVIDSYKLSLKLSMGPILLVPTHFHMDMG